MLKRWSFSLFDLSSLIGGLIMVYITYRYTDHCLLNFYWRTLFVTNTLRVLVPSSESSVMVDQSIKLEQLLLFWRCKQGSMDRSAPELVNTTFRSLWFSILYYYQAFRQKHLCLAEVETLKSAYQWLVWSQYRWRGERSQSLWTISSEGRLWSQQPWRCWHESCFNGLGAGTTVPPFGERAVDDAADHDWRTDPMVQGAVTLLVNIVVTGSYGFDWKCRTEEQVAI